MGVDFDPPTYSVPHALTQNVQDTSISFFFSHYAGTAFDPEARNGFNQLWQPMYRQATTQSPLQLATTAITVNIAMMWSFRGCDTWPARHLFTKAVAVASDNLRDPLHNSTDEMLMTILLLDLYDALALHYAPGHLNYGKHKLGALAMIEHRGLTNLATTQGRTLVRAVRHTLLPYLLASREPFPERLDHVFDHPLINGTKVSTLDCISVQLSRVQGRLWKLRLGDRLYKSFEDRRRCYAEIVAEAIRVENLFQDWKASITNSDWLPEYAPRELVVESIRNAGFYGTRCSIWMDLAIAGTWILYSIRHLLTLQVIRQCFADEPTLLNDTEQQELLPRTEKMAQDLADSICEAIPFYLGDTTTPKNPMYSASITFPYTFKRNREAGTRARFPSSYADHQIRAGASGGWMLFPQLVNLWRLAEPEDDAVAIILREGQLNWIKEQVKRLQKIFLFCEPVWFKRGAAKAVKPGAVWELEEQSVVPSSSG